MRQSRERARGNFLSRLPHAVNRFFTGVAHQLHVPLAGHPRLEGAVISCVCAVAAEEGPETRPVKGTGALSRKN